MNREQEKTEKAAMKAKLAAEKLDKSLGSRTAKVKEPVADPLSTPDPSKPKKERVFGAADNTLSKDTAACIHSIVRAADSTLNTNTEANIQDQICQIIRQGFAAYQLHTGQPFDTDLG